MKGHDNSVPKRLSVLPPVLLIASAVANAADGYVSGQVTSLKVSASKPAIRIASNAVPARCDGRNYGWFEFSGTAQEMQWIYATAMAMAVAGQSVTVYTNTDDTKCRIYDIQVSPGLN